MRFRPANYEYTALWVLSLFLGIALTIVNLHHDIARHRTGWAYSDEMVLAIFIISFFIPVYAWLFSRIEFEPDALRFHNGFNSRRIPYREIVAVRTVQKKGRPVPRQLEIETAPVSADIYPHNYLVYVVSDPSAVMQAIHDKAPAAEYGPLPA